jgi:hypothetical protein
MRLVVYIFIATLPSVPNQRNTCVNYNRGLDRFGSCSYRGHHAHFERGAVFAADRDS